MFAWHTHSLPITTGSGQTTTHYSSSYLCISKLPNYQIRSTQISPPSHPDLYNTLYQDKLSGQSNTSPKLRWTGNSPIWGKFTVPAGVSSIYDHPTHTDLAYANLTSKILQLYVPPQPHRSFQRTIDHIVDRYILLKLLETSLPEYTRNNYQPL